jgi:nucleoside-diphosphate-sugar epimerase
MDSMLENINILVRGSSGRIGTALCSQIESNMPSFTKISPRNSIGSLTLYLQDQRFSTLIIIASGNSDNSSSKNSCTIDSQNISEFLHYIDKSKISKPNDQMLFISSGGTIYGSEGELFTEFSPVNPETPYAEEKISQEILIREWAHSHGIRPLMFRLANVYSMNSVRPKGLVERAIHSLSVGDSIHVTSNLNSRKQYGSSRDYANWILSTWREIHFVPEVSVVNLFPPHSYSIQEVLVKVRDRFSKDNRGLQEVYESSRTKLDTVILGTGYELGFLRGDWLSLEQSLATSEDRCICAECA